MPAKMNKQYTEEDTFNALRQTKLERVQIAVAEAQGSNYRLEHADLIKVLKEHNWKVSEYWKQVKAASK